MRLDRHQRLQDVVFVLRHHRFSFHEGHPIEFKAGSLVLKRNRLAKRSEITFGVLAPVFRNRTIGGHTWLMASAFIGTVRVRVYHNLEGRPDQRFGVNKIRLQHILGGWWWPCIKHKYVIGKTNVGEKVVDVFVKSHRGIIIHAAHLSTHFGETDVQGVVRSAPMKYVIIKVVTGISVEPWQRERVVGNTDDLHVVVEHIQNGVRVVTF